MLGRAGYYNQNSADGKENPASWPFKAIAAPIARSSASTRFRKICREEKEGAYIAPAELAQAALEARPWRARNEPCYRASSSANLMARGSPMKLQDLLSVVTVLLVLTSAASAQESAFKAGQTVYVVAMKISGQPDLSTERKLKDEFEKQKAFKVATSLQSADFVFLMLVEYEYNQMAAGGVGIGSEDIKSVAAFAVSPDAYTQHKSDLDNLRDKALWQISENNIIWRTGGLPKKIVKKFHENAAPKKR
jgi:hypothetical protein